MSIYVYANPKGKFTHISTIRAATTSKCAVLVAAHAPALTSPPISSLRVVGGVASAVTAAVVVGEGHHGLRLKHLWRAGVLLLGAVRSATSRRRVLVHAATTTARAAEVILAIITSAEAAAIPESGTRTALVERHTCTKRMNNYESMR